MEWPPPKAWTSTSLKEGFRHFVAINYGGKGIQRWVNLVAVLDGTTRLRLSWKELKDPSLWNVGWQKLSREDANPISAQFISRDADDPNCREACLHASLDSGLLIPCDRSSSRGWT